MTGVRQLGPLLLAGLLAMTATLAACVTATPVLQHPEGFAEFDVRGEYRAVSPEGVVVRVRLVPNEPPQVLSFWTEALKLHLVKSGYTLLKEETFDAPAGPGVLFEWVAPMGSQDWIYLTAVSVVGTRIAIAEAAGPQQSYAEHRAALVTGLATLAVK